MDWSAKSLPHDIIKNVMSFMATPYAVGRFVGTFVAPFLLTGVFFWALISSDQMRMALVRKK
jgi:hypothetical protein